MVYFEKSIKHFYAVEWPLISAAVLNLRTVFGSDSNEIERKSMSIEIRNKFDDMILTQKLTRECG